MNLKDLYHDIILEHGTHPRNLGAIPEASHKACGYNPLCGDQVTLYLQCVDDKIVKVTFEGNGCAISMASASLLTEALQGKTKDEALALFNQFHNMLTQEIEPADDLGKLQSLANVRSYPVRVKCATLAWHALLEALNGKKSIDVPTKTEP